MAVQEDSALRALADFSQPALPAGELKAETADAGGPHDLVRRASRRCRMSRSASRRSSTTPVDTRRRN